MNEFTQRNAPMDQRCDRRMAADDPADRPRYAPPRLRCHGALGPLIRGASWKGVDSVGELNADEESYPG